MAAITPVPGRIELMSRIGKALGVTIPFTKLVIECDVNSYVKLYVVAPADMKNVEQLESLIGEIKIEQVQSVSVADNADVVFVPKGN